MTETNATVVHHLVRRWVESDPDQVAIRSHDGPSVTYGQLWAMSARVAVEVMGAVPPGRAAAVALDRSVELCVAVLAAARAGRTYVLLDPAAPMSRHLAIVQQAAAAAVLGGDDPLWQLPPGLPVLPVPELMHRAGPALPGVTVTGDDLLYLAFTSGSTGRPKGIRTPHRSVAAFLADRRLCDLSPSDCVASVSSPASDATTMEIWKPLVTGGTVAILPHPLEVMVEEWPELLERLGVTVLFLMAPMLEMLVREDPTLFAALRTLIFGGDAISIDAVRELCRVKPPARVVQGYGPTEVTVFGAVFVCDPRSLEGRDTVPLGVPLDGYEMGVFDEDGDPVPPGGQGEIWISGPGVADGYLGADGGPFVPAGPGGERTYRTGDLARVGADGEITFVGRRDRQVKIRGHRVELPEIERAVLGTGLVDAAVVDLVEDPAGQPQLVCFYTAPAGLDRELAGRMARLVPGYMVPQCWRRVPRMPLNNVQKVDRARLREELRRDRSA